MPSRPWLKAKAHSEGFWMRDHVISLKHMLATTRQSVTQAGLYQVLATSLLMSLGPSSRLSPPFFARSTYPCCVHMGGSSMPSVRIWLA